MENISTMFSLLFILAFSIYLFFGIDIFRIDPKESVNKAFFALNMALCIWSFGYALGNIASNIEIALFWRRIASIGRIHTVGIILHFIILLTYEKDKLSRKWYLLLLHIPALILIYVFSISNIMAPLQYNLIQIEYGWSNVIVDNIWNKIYYIYLSIYMILTAVVLVKWKKRIRDKKMNKRVELILNTMLITLIFAITLDMIPNRIFEKPLPQISIIVILIPVGFMYYGAKYFQIFQMKMPGKLETIASQEERANIFKSLSLGFYISGIFAFIVEYTQYVNNENAFKFALIKALLLIGIGITINLIQKIEIESRKDNLTILILIISVPLIILQYLKYGALTVWAFPILIIIISIIFSKLNLLILTTVISIITQFLIWAINPEVIVIVDKFDYILRIGIFIVAFFIGLYINRIYINKIKENKHQIEFQNLGSDVLFQFVNLNQENYDEKIDYLLKKIGMFFNVDRTYLFTINYKDKTMIYSNEWCNIGIAEEMGMIEEISLDTFAWFIKELEEKDLVYIDDIDLMPEEATEKEAGIHKQGAKSLVAVPVLGEDGIQGFIGMDSVKETKKWSEENIEMLNIMANLLSSGMAQIKSDKEVQFMAYYDNLTKLPNRFLFEDKVNQRIRECEESGESIAVVFIDLDNFKSVNDTIGHRGGDKLLNQVAKNLSRVIRKEDLISRFSGDEFAIMINKISNHDLIINIAEEIMGVFADFFNVDGQEFAITASAGIAIYPRDGKNAGELIKNADIAMYGIKANGKNQYGLCTEEIKNTTKKNLELSIDLHHALERNELVVYYQPQLDINTNRIIGTEALIRWNHPTIGVISPGIFIPIAEKNNLINSIGEWVLKIACKQNKKWQYMGLPPMVMSVNLSGVQIINPKIVENVDRIIKETGLDPKYIKLEITENIAIKHEDYVINVLEKLRKIGVKIAIDDFGTEYSSLTRLKILPIDQIKIDMQFVQGIEKNEKDRAITMIIINLAKSLGLEVLAEGVETKGQLDFLRENKCQYVQGYYYYKPMSKQEIESILVDLYDKKTEKN